MTGSFKGFILGVVVGAAVVATLAWLGRASAPAVSIDAAAIDEVNDAANVPIAVSSEFSPAAASVDPDRAAIAALNERLLDALNAGDWARLNALTDDDYVAIINGRAIAGRANLEASNRRFLEQWRDTEAWLPDETVVDGGLAFQRGSFTMTLTPRKGDGAARELAGTYLHIYQRKADGSWALTRAMAETAGD